MDPAHTTPPSGPEPNLMERLLQSRQPPKVIAASLEQILAAESHLHLIGRLALDIAYGIDSRLKRAGLKPTAQKANAEFVESAVAAIATLILRVWDDHVAFAEAGLRPEGFHEYLAKKGEQYRGDLDESVHNYFDELLQLAAEEIVATAEETVVFENLAFLRFRIYLPR